jgi:hypothetical protein
MNKKSHIKQNNERDYDRRRKKKKLKKRCMLCYFGAAVVEVEVQKERRVTPEMIERVLFEEER